MEPKYIFCTRHYLTFLGIAILILGMISACILPSIAALVTNTPTVSGNTLPVSIPTSTGIKLTLVPTKGLHAPVNLTTMGDPNATVKIDAWEDFQCPACKQYSETIEPQVLQNYVETGKVFYTFHFFPFLDGGKGESHQAAYAAMCAAEQGHFWDYHDMLFANWLGENAGSFTDARLTAIASAVNLDMNSFTQCYQTGKYAAQVEQDYQAGGTQGVQGTPSVFVNGTLLTPGYIPSYNDIAQAVDAALAGH